jgi:RimJ/RimL family protein N-acetyltransferase
MPREHSHTTPVRLRDGARVLVRPLERDDAWAVEAVFARLSDRSRRLRFAGSKPRLSAQDVELLTDVDHRDHDALVALDERTGEPVAIVRFVRDGESGGSAEVAFEVVDEWQGRTLGTVLTALLACRARLMDVQRFRASVDASNRRALDVVRRLGKVRRHGFDGGTVEVEVELDGCGCGDGAVAA